MTTTFTVGIGISGGDATELLRRIEAAERAGVQAVWLTSGGVVPDPLAVLAAAATSTTNLLLGTSIVPFLPRHPLAMWQSALAVHQLSDGRFRLGIGASTRRVAERNMGIAWPNPHIALEEYLAILLQLADTGKVDFAGTYYTVKDRTAGPAAVPVYVAALRERAFQLAGRLAAGAISWVAPSGYIKSRAIPALREGASSAGRPTPPLVMHVAAAVTNDRGSAESAFLRQLGIYPRIQEYARMFADQGFKNEGGVFEPALLRDLVISGSPEEVHVGLNLLASTGATELLVTPLDCGSGTDEIVRAIGAYRHLSAQGQPLRKLSS